MNELSEAMVKAVWRVVLSRIALFFHKIAAGSNRLNRCFLF